MRSERPSARSWRQDRGGGGTCCGQGPHVARSVHRVRRARGGSDRCSAHCVLSFCSSSAGLVELWFCVKSSIVLPIYPPIRHRANGVRGVGCAKQVAVVRAQMEARARTGWLCRWLVRRSVFPERSQRRRNTNTVFHMSPTRRGRWVVGRRRIRQWWEQPGGRCVCAG